MLRVDDFGDDFAERVFGCRQGSLRSLVGPDGTAGLAQHIPTSRVLVNGDQSRIAETRRRTSFASRWLLAEGLIFQRHGVPGWATDARGSVSG